MRQYQKNGKMTMRLRRCGMRPDDAAAVGHGRGMEAAVTAASPAIVHRRAHQARDMMCATLVPDRAYSITSSARAMSEGGTVRPSAFEERRGGDQHEWS